MTAVTKHIIRLACDAHYPNALVEKTTELKPFFHQGEDVEFQIGIFNRDALMDSSNIESLSVEIRTNSTDINPVVLALTSTINDSLTLADWLSDDDSHAVLSLSSSQNTLEAGTYFLSVIASTSTTTIFLGQTYVTVLASSLGGTPTGTIDNYYTKVESDGRYATTASVYTTTEVDTFIENLKFWSNVKDFGAVGDGVTDDTSAINLAIANARQTTGSRTSGDTGVVYFPSGLYKISSSLVVDSDITYVGNHGNATSWIMQTTNSTPIFTVNTYKDSFKIKDLTLCATGTGVRGISSTASYPSNARFENLRFSISLEVGIYGQYIGCNFNDIRCLPVGNFLGFTESTYIPSNRVGMLFIGGSNNLNNFNNCCFQYAGKGSVEGYSGVFVSNGGENLRLNNPWFENNDTKAIYLQDVLGTYIEGGWFEGNSLVDEDYLINLNYTSARTILYLNNCTLTHARESAEPTMIYGNNGSYVHITNCDIRFRPENYGNHIITFKNNSTSVTIDANLGLSSYVDIGTKQVRKLKFGAFYPTYDFNEDQLVLPDNFSFCETTIRGVTAVSLTPTQVNGDYLDFYNTTTSPIFYYKTYTGVIPRGTFFTARIQATGKSGLRIDKNSDDDYIQCYFNQTAITGIESVLASEERVSGGSINGYGVFSGCSSDKFYIISLVRVSNYIYARIFSESGNPSGLYNISTANNWSASGTYRIGIFTAGSQYNHTVVDWFDDSTNISDT